MWVRIVACFIDKCKENFNFIVQILWYFYINLGISHIVSHTKMDAKYAIKLC